jgi:SAM-dependent methyltransferase
MASIPSKSHNPHLYTLPAREKEAWIHRHLDAVKAALRVPKISVLDIGGGKGYGLDLFGSRSDVDYHALDLACHRPEGRVTFHRGDITDPSLSLPLKFDCVFTKDTYEHILNPWDSTTNILSLLKDGGRLIFIAPFSWRYHASPYDSYRYTHTGARYLFERLGGMACIETAYIAFDKIRTAGFWKNKKDFTIDSKPFEKPIGVAYVAERRYGHAFQRSELDADHCPHHRS